MARPPAAAAGGLADNRPMPAAVLNLLAIETSTDTLSVAVEGPQGCAAYQGPGAAQASTTLLPAVQTLLDQAGCTLAALDAIVFARGPGAFTGLRTACSVAQGLAYGARAGGVPVLPVDTLLALADEACHQRTLAGQPVPPLVVALLDARMDELYVALYAHGPQGLTAEPLAPPRLCGPDALAAWLQQVLPAGHSLAAGGVLLAGNVFSVYGERLGAVPGERQPALPTAAALLRLAPGLLAAGAAVPAHAALPRYVRDKVAQTTAEREAAA